MRPGIAVSKSIGVLGAAELGLQGLEVDLGLVGTNRDEVENLAADTLNGVLEALQGGDDEAANDRDLGQDARLADEEVKELAHRQGQLEAHAENVSKVVQARKSRE